MIKSQKILNILFVLLMILCLLYYCFSFIKSDQNNKKKEQEIKELCLSDKKNEIENNQPGFITFCNELLTTNNKEQMDFYTMYTNVTLFGAREFSDLFIIMILSLALINISSYLKNSMIKNECTRIDYKKIKKKMLKNVYKYSLILPILTLLVFAICLIYTKNINPEYAILHSTTGWARSTMQNFCIFTFLYITNIWIHSVLYLNFALCIVRKHHNFFVSLILTFLAIIGVEAILEIVFGGIICKTLLGSDIGIIFNIMNMYAFNDQYGLGVSMIVPLVLTVGSSILVYIKYHNKEKLIIDCESNE